jgi:excisionase family DNA binding protein
MTRRYFTSAVVILSAEEVADRLKLPNARAVYRLIREARLPHFYVGRLLRFREDEIDQWLIAQQPQIEVDTVIRAKVS